jgi:hypothetical protein
VVVAKRDFTESALRYISAINRGTATPSITLDSAVSFVASGTSVVDRSIVVVPAIEADPILQSSRGMITRQHARVPIEAIETYGPSGLPPFVEIGDLSVAEASGLDSYDGIPIFPIDAIDFSSPISIGVRQFATETASGLASIVNRWGSRPAIAARASWRALNRDVWFKLQSLWEYAGGPLLPFWFASIDDAIDFRSFVASTKILTVDAIGDVSDWDWRPYVAIVQRSTGIVEIRRVVEVNRSGNHDLVEVESAFTFGENATDVRRCSTAIQARFDQDELESRWATWEICDTDFSVVEVLPDEADEDEVAITNIVDVADSLGTVDTIHDPAQCAPNPAFLLTSCIDGETMIVRTGVEDYVGDVVSLQGDAGDCWTVSSYDSDEVDEETVVVSTDYADCSGLLCGGCVPGTLSINTFGGSNRVCHDLIDHSAGLDVGGATYSAGNFSATLKRHTTVIDGPDATPYVVMRCRTVKVDKEDVARIRITGTASIASPTTGEDGVSSDGFRLSARIMWKNTASAAAPFNCIILRSLANGDAITDSLAFEFVFDYNPTTEAFEVHSGESTDLTGLGWISVGTSSIPKADITISAVGAQFFAEAGTDCSTSEWYTGAISNLKIHYDEAIPP